MIVKYLLSFVFIAVSSSLFAQENYEIQVYSSPTQARHSSIFELHSNFTFDGERQIVNKVLPSYHAIHETIEITTGITDNFEIGFYLFTNVAPGNGFKFVGSHIRPRITAPLSWGLPVGLSLSAEFGTQQSAYSEDTWSVEIRPIIDKQWDKLYISLNPTLAVSIAGTLNNHTPVFNPNIKLAYQFFKTTTLGLEYYGTAGYINHFDKISEQQHAFYLVYDLAGNDKWELNMGAGYGATSATDKWVGKILVGRKIYWKTKK